MANLNRIILVGKLVAEPEMRSTLDNIPMTRFKLSVSRLQGGFDLIDVVAWRRLAEICGQYLRKDQLILVEGRIQVRSFEDQTGIRKWATEVIARNMQMLERSSGQPGIRPSGEIKEPMPEPEEKLEDLSLDETDLESDLPF